MEPKLCIVFDGPPGPEGGRFVEVESPFGQSIRVGEWKQCGKFWVLELTPDDFPTEEDILEEKRNNGPFGVGA